MRKQSLSQILNPRRWTTNSLFSATAILIYLSAVKFLIPFLTHSDFEFHRDEFLYMAMADYLSWGFMEVPPSIAVFAKFTFWLFGNSLIAVRFFPALTGAFTVFLVGLITREMGGKRFAQFLAATAYLVSLIYLRINLFFMPVTFETFYFVLGVYAFVRILKTDAPKWWIILGVVTGLSMLNKYSMLLFGFGVAVGLLFTPHREKFKNKWLWISAIIVLLIWLPNLAWQHSLGWPFFEHMRVLSATQLSNINPITFLLVQMLINLYADPIWLLGLFFLFRSPEGSLYRPLGWMYVSILTVLLLLSGKIYYLAPAYPMLFAAGSVFIEGFAHRKSKNWVKPAISGFLILGSMTMLPIAFPLASVDGLIKYFEFGSKYMGIKEALRWEDGQFYELPQDYADMQGWEGMAATIASTYYSLPDSDRVKCTIFASNYGEAGALNYYAEKYKIPKAISQNGSFWLWKYGEATGEVIITVGFDEGIKDFFTEVYPGEQFKYEHAREDGIPIFIGYQLTMSMNELWDYLKKYRY
ncbi:MAG: glycosyltransferase family 39 protein [Candidatus Marinimicrobia bacterium]|nr:glycosyltransferase family 39 protein [Candidatus Neomarinimicrobiota bacterium]